MTKGVSKQVTEKGWGTCGFESFWNPFGQNFYKTVCFHSLPFSVVEVRPETSWDPSPLLWLCADPVDSPFLKVTSLGGDFSSNCKRRIHCKRMLDGSVGTMMALSGVSILGIAISAHKCVQAQTLVGTHRAVTRGRLQACRLSQAAVSIV